MITKKKIGALIGAGAVLAAAYYGGPIAGKVVKERVLPAICSPDAAISDLLSMYCNR